MAEPRIPLTDRFWSKVLKTETCWLWQAGLNNKGYGRFQYFNRTQRPGLGRDLYAHRVSWMLAHGEIPDGLEVIHDCDTPACVRPDHLRLGTHAENMEDCARKGRRRTGKPWNKRLLSADDIRAVRKDSRSLGQIAYHYGISRSYVFGIKRKTVCVNVPD